MNDIAFEASPDELVFVPLGGAGEIGMNLNLYGLDGKWLMVDCGVTFGEDKLPGVDVVMPDPSFIEQRRDDLLGIVVTHAHEDHLGAIQYLWPRLQCPVYATPFAATVLDRKLGETDFADMVDVHEVELGGHLSLGPFEIEFITITHSILEPNALAIRTRFGTVLHTGDFKIDDDPIIGETTDETTLRALGDAGVLAMVCDSTNVFEPGESGSEGALSDSLDALIANRKGRVAVTTFASNVARIKAWAEVAQRHDRHLALIGRSLWQITTAARECGYLTELPNFLDAAEAAFLPPDKVLLLCTGCQGEPRGAMSRIAAGTHPHVALDPGDLVVFSSRIIPGNERAIGQLHNSLSTLGVDVVTEKDHFVHVSGHPSRDELAQYYQWVRPQIAIPVHGERRHIAEHAAYARTLQVPEAIESTNGAVIRLAPGPAGIVDHVTHGRLAVDGAALVATDSDVLRARRRLMFDGAAFVALVVDQSGHLVAEPRLQTTGIVDTDDELTAGLAALIRARVDDLPAGARRDDEAIRECVRLTVRREIKRNQSKRPAIGVELVRI